MNDAINIFELYLESAEQPQMHVDEHGDRVWRLHGRLHREDGPAVENADGTNEWWMNDRLHRTDGAAIEHVDGSKAWYVDGKWYEPNDLHAWAIAALKYEGKEPTKEMIEQKIQSVMQQDLFD